MTLANFQTHVYRYIELANFSRVISFDPDVGIREALRLIASDKPVMMLAKLLTRAMQLCDTESHRDVYQVLCEHAPRRKRGQYDRKKISEANPSRGGFVSEADPHGKRRNTLAVRLAKEHPKFFKQYLEGHFKSIRAAAEAAGLVQPPGSSPRPEQLRNHRFKRV